MHSYMQSQIQASTSHPHPHPHPRTHTHTPVAVTLRAAPARAPELAEVRGRRGHSTVRGGRLSPLLALHSCDPFSMLHHTQR
eukprot:1155522-Pelagomonas_calceolata.AAC.7